MITQGWVKDVVLSRQIGVALIDELLLSLQIGQHIDEYEKRIREVTRCSDIVYAAQRSEGYEMSRFGSYLSALSEHEKRDPDMKQLAEVGLY